MSQEYSRACLRVAVAQICQHLGWNSIHTTPMELLTDVLERYLFQIGKVTHRYSEQFGRTDARLEDVMMAFTHMGVQVHELEDYVKHVEPLPFAKEVVAYPAPQENDLKFPNPDSKEVQQRKVFEYVPEYLPYMHPELNEEPEDTNQSARPASPERLQVEPQMVEMSPVPGEKRPVCSPGDSSVPPFKRQRLTTSQPLPEEASQSQYEMTSVVMTHSGILSPIREGKVPDSKPPPAGFKQIVIVRQKSAAGQPANPGIHLPSDASVIKLDFNKDPNKGGKIVEIDDNVRDSGALDFDKNDPEYRPKAKKKFKDLKKDKLPQKPFKIKRGPGRPRSPGRAAAVVHNRGSVGFSRIPAVSQVSQMTGSDQEVPIDLSLKPTPPPPNISVIKSDDKDKEQDHVTKILDYRPKTAALSKQQEKDYENTIDSVIRNKTEDSTKPLHKEVPVVKERNSKQIDEWRVSHISESYIGDEDDENKDRPGTDNVYPPPPPTTIAPHLKFLYDAGTPTSSVAVSPRRRGRPRGSGSGFYRSFAGRSPIAGRRGRPPLHRGSPGRPPLNRSPGRPPLNRSPGRPPLNRSPGRPSSGRSPGRPKGSGLSPRPRGRPRGSKSPRSRGASPRGGSPRAITHLKFDESNDSATHIFKLENYDSEATLFEFPSRSPAPATPKKEVSPVPISRTSSAEDRSSSIPSPAPTEPAGSTGSRDLSPVLSPSSDHSLSSKKETTPDEVTRFSSDYDQLPSNERAFESEKRDADLKKPWDTNQDIKLEIDREIARKEDLAERERKERERSLGREYEDREREHKERSTDRESKAHREHSRDRDHKERDRGREYKERSRDREREHKEHRDKDRSRDREREYKEHSRDRERVPKEQRDKEREHKEHSRDKDSRDREHKEHSKDRDRDRSKEHRKDKKKKKKKNRDREKEREDEKERKEKHKEKKEREREKESREESPSVLPLQKLKIKFGGGSASSPGSFSISTSNPVNQSTIKHEPSPKPEHVAPSPRPEIPKLKFKMLPPKSDASNESDQSWVSSIKKEESMLTSPARTSPGPGSRTVSPKPKSAIDSDSENMSDDGLKNDKPEKSGEEEVTVSVVKGKVIVKKPAKRGKRKGSGKKGRPKGDSFKKEPSSLLFGESTEGLLSAIKRETDKEASPISPPFSPQNVPSPITIPALKAAPPPPSPPAPSKKISPPKPKLTFKEQKPISPLVKDIIKPKPPPVQVSKQTKITKSPRRLSPKKSPKISPTSKKKGNISPVKTSPSKSFLFTEITSPRTPSPHRSSSPASGPSSPMYSPASSPARDSPLHFQIPPTPAFPTRIHSPPASPLSRQISTDDEIEVPPLEKPRMPPPELPPMPPTSAQRRAQRAVITETVGSFVNESGEKIWICPACTMQDDGSAMIGCDMCDDWYHWVCVGIRQEPGEDESWYCPKCTKPNKSKGKRGRKKRKS